MIRASNNPSPCNPVVLSTELPKYIHDFVSEADQQTFEIPEGYKIENVFLNRTFLTLEEYTHEDNILTIIETLETGTIISTR